MSAINHTKGALFLGTRGDSNNQIPSKYFGFIKMLTYPILTARSLATLSGPSNDKIPSKYFGLIKMFSFTFRDWKLVEEFNILDKVNTL